ncbi:MAG TPA: histidine kinase [Thermoleophilaceae bacterium]
MARVVAAPLRFDVALAALVAALALVDAAFERPDEPAAVAVVTALVTTLPIAWRTVAPGPAALVATLGFLLAVALGTPQDQPVVTAFAPLVTLFALGEHGSPRALRTAGAVSVLAWSTAGIWDGDPGSSVFGLCVSAGAILVGRAVRAISFETDVLEARVGSLQEDQERLAREAVGAERERISRELHDVIGHSISVMGIQAGAVRRVLPPELAREREMLEAIERTGRDSVEEMRRLIDLLSADDDAPDAALPTLGRVAALVEDVRRAGLDVELELGDDLADLPPGRSLAGYRIVQEALTNSLKHAPESRVFVRVARSASDVEIEIRSAASAGANGAHGPGGGRGLIGMRERAALYGGTFGAGPTPDGGFHVVTTLPIAGT